MRIHYLNCVSTCPLGGSLMDGGIREGTRGRLTCTCMLVETARGLVLIDTGFGLRDVAAPRTRLSKFFLFLLKPELREEMTAVRQIARLGFAPSDVQHIVLTHLDFDHAGGLDDFPNATVHLLRSECTHASAQATWLDRQRFRPQQWSTRQNWRLYTAGDGDPWYGFEAVRGLDGCAPEILLIPLLGHTFGHCGVAVQTDDTWVLNAGDAYFFHGEMHPQDPRCTPGLLLYQAMMEKDREARLENQDRLRQLRRTHGSEVELLCSHDVHEFERMSGRASTDLVAPRVRSRASLSTHPVPPRPGPRA